MYKYVPVEITVKVEEVWLIFFNINQYSGYPIKYYKLIEMTRWLLQAV
jgi:hypothetical protein